MNRSYPILKRFALVVFLPLALCAGGAFYAMRGSLPKAQSSLKADDPRRAAP